jgi:MoxR-like ATPase
MANSSKTPSTKKVISVEEVKECRAIVNDIYIDTAIKEYIVDLVHCTRKPAKVDPGLGPLIRSGASPRATINLALAAKASAFIAGRSFVTPQDIKDLAPDVFRHRILLSYEAEAENVTTDEIIQRILKRVIVP